MDDGLLSLKWNNHRSTFFHMLSSVRRKECYTDVTLACDGNFYPVHKLVLSTCSEYFEQMFEQTQCKHPVIVLKDIRCEDLESLLSYMYVGEVNVVQEKLAGLIKAAECLKIKGLAVPDEDPPKQTLSSGRSGSSGGGGGGGGGRDKRTSDSFGGSEAKRRKQDGASDMYRQSNANSRNEERRRLSVSNSSHAKTRNPTNNSNFNSSSNLSDGSIDRDWRQRSSPQISSPGRTSPPKISSPPSEVLPKSPKEVKEEEVDNKEEPAGDEVTLDDSEQENSVKPEPLDLDAVYLSDSPGSTAGKDLLMDGFPSDGQQHFMDELMGHVAASGDMGVGVGDNEYETGQDATGLHLQQQHMVRGFYDGASPQTTASLEQLFTSDCEFTRSERQQQPSSRSGITKGTKLHPSPYTNTDGEMVAVSPYNCLNLHELLTPRKTYQCPVCLRESGDKAQFRRHYMTHTGEKPYSCPLCTYKCIRKDDLKFHIMRKHQQ